MVGLMGPWLWCAWSFEALLARASQSLRTDRTGNRHWCCIGCDSVCIVAALVLALVALVLALVAIKALRNDKERDDS